MPAGTCRRRILKRAKTTLMNRIQSTKPVLLLAMVCWMASCAVIPTCPNQLLPVVEVQVNNSASTHDDYINTTGFTPCRARITNVNRAFGSGLNFPGGVAIELRNRNLSTDLTVSATSSGTTSAFFATLPGNGGWLNFFIRGNATSTIDKSAILELATAGATCNEVVLSRKALMVPSGTPPIPSTPGRPQVEIEVGSVSHLDDYITWAPTTCRIKWANPTTPTATLNVTLRNMGTPERLRFSGTAPAPGTTATSATVTVTLTGDAWANFYVAGNNGNASVNDKDAVIEVVDGTGQLLSREGVMVRIRKNVNSLTTTERDRYLEALRDAHQTYNSYMSFRNAHSRNGAGFANIGHRQAHIGSAFLPWHRAFVLNLERILQASDPSVALPYWHFDQSSPGMFSPEFMGANNPAGTTAAVLAASNPISTWNIPGQPVGIRRRTPYGNAGIPSSVTGTGTGVATEAGTLALGANYANFKNMEGTTHNGAHNNSGNGGVSWIGGDPAIAPQDPLFYFLHCNVDRLWAKWQWVNNRFDGTQVGTYDLQGSHAAPVIAPAYAETATGRITLNRTFGQYVDDTLWPWDNITGTGGGTAVTAERPVVAPLTPFPIVLGGIFPGSRPTVKNTIDFRLSNFAYDDFFPY